ncbi:MAG: polysaccharide deacetylase family protein [Clostridia bacterium]|nr:polysaccharide deacetylase family protein [Clostridia bacterium]
MEKYLIINCDDFGMCHAANVAVFDLLEHGGVTSATVMAPCGWAPEAFKYAAAHPEFAIGLHLTFTSEWNKYKWRPVSNGNTASLRDDSGFMHFHCDTFELKADEAEVEAEIRAQLALARFYGHEPSHMDNHMGSLYGIETGRSFLPIVFKVCAENNLPYRMMREVPKDYEISQEFVDQAVAVADKLEVPILDHLWEHSWSGPQSDSYENFRDYIFTRFENCPDGIVETYIHPSAECDELKNTSSVWFRRVWEYRLFSDPATRKHIEANGIKLINYRDLAAMRRGQR